MGMLVLTEEWRERKTSRLGDISAESQEIINVDFSQQPKINSSNNFDKIFELYDFILTPSSFVRYVNNHRDEISDSDYYFNSTFAYTFEAVRLGMYGVFAVMLPLIPLGFLTAGLLSYLYSANKKNKEKNER
ncbi:MAG TPA: hypothetical protein VJZ93_02360 [Candidatus Nanoarchaeia archaeon]|nr:hypothetical protein [Candidatus Nanoarchaeia archaeon]